MKSAKKISFVAIVFSMASLIIMPTVANAVAGDAPAQNTIINSSPLYADNGQSYHACNVMNITTSAVNIKVDVLNSSGAVLATSGAAAVTLSPGKFLEIANAQNYSGFARCRISGTIPSNIRANLTVFHWTGSYYDSLAISEVR